MRISDWSSDVCSSDLLARTGRRETQHMFGTIVAQIALREVAKNDAIVAEHLDPPHFAFARPARRPISFGLLRFLCAPDRHAHRHYHPGHPARHPEEDPRPQDPPTNGDQREPPPKN